MEYKTLREAESAIEDYERETMSKFSIYRKDKKIRVEGIHYFEIKIFREKTIKNFTCMYKYIHTYAYIYIYIYISYIIYIVKFMAYTYGWGSLPVRFKINFLGPCWVYAPLRNVMPSILLAFVWRPYLVTVYKFVLRRVVFNCI